MQIAGAGYFGGCLAQPAAILIQTCIDTDEVGTGQVDSSPLAIHGPTDVEAVEVGVVIGMIIDISPSEGIKDVISSRTACINAVLRQKRAVESQFILL